MSRSEFRYNKKRKHYAYLFKDEKGKIANILLTSKPLMIEKQNKRKQRITKNVPLYRHPNKNKQGQFYIIPLVCHDFLRCFDEHIYLQWRWNINDKRKIKRIKRYKKIGYDTN